MDLVTILLIAGAFYLGWVVRGAIILGNLSEDPDKVIKILEKIKKINEAEEAGFEPKDAEKIANGVKVRAEVVHDTYYLYSLEDNQFISQGATIEDAFLVAKNRFPGKSFWLEKKDISNQTA